jgi:Fe-S-cluster containining protein
MRADPSARYSDPTLPQRQAEREPIALERARRKAEQLAHTSAAAHQKAGQLILAARNAPTVRQRVVWIHRAASAWANALAPLAACRKGCAHCCRIPVSISRTEAEILAKASGRAIASSAQVVSARAGMTQAQLDADVEHARRFTGSHAPCPFLVNEDCSVYNDRPTACRAQLNMDDDALLCELASSRSASVPYANWQWLIPYALAVEPHVQLADIRDFFPPGSSS